MIVINALVILSKSYPRLGNDVHCAENKAQSFEWLKEQDLRCDLKLRGFSVLRNIRFNNNGIFIVLPLISLQFSMNFLEENFDDKCKLLK